MRSRFAFEKMPLLVLTVFLLFVLSACGGGKVIKSDPVAEGSGKPSTQSAKKETQTEHARDGRFIAYDNGTVRDTRTGLMWAANDNGSNINWANARSFCKDYRGGGYTDWRMPTQDELAGLYDATKNYNVACGYVVHLTELIHFTCMAAWASETSGSNAAYFNINDSRRAWRPQSEVGYFRVLPVRSGK